MGLDQQVADIVGLLDDHRDMMQTHGEPAAHHGDRRGKRMASYEPVALPVNP